MTMVGSAETATTTRAPVAGLVDWGAVIAGAVLASALSFVLLTFGTAIGLTTVSPWPGSGVSAKLAASLAVFWVIAQQIGALMIGGYVAGRLRVRRSLTEDEVAFRDGVHGALVWALALIVGAFLLMSAAAGLGSKGADMAARATPPASADALDSAIDMMLRPGTQAPPAAAQSQGSAQEARAEIGRVLRSAIAGGGMTDQTRTYLAQVVSRRTGLNQQEAQQRVVEAETNARQAADTARRGAILAGFVTAAGLLISLAAAWWAGMKGGTHQDNAVPARLIIARRTAANS